MAGSAENFLFGQNHFGAVGKKVITVFLRFGVFNREFGDMSHHWGYVGAVSAAVLFGLSSTLNKIILADVHPLVVAGLIYFIAGVFLFALRLSPLHEVILNWMETPTKVEPTMERKDYVVLLLVALSGAVVASFLFIYGLSLTTAVNASLLLNMESLFTSL